jgi:microcystin-dependent protein
MEGTMATILLFGGNFAPQNWTFCHGQLISISSNSALFALLGTQFGGDGHTTFALPDLRGRVPVGAGDGPGLTMHEPGQIWGRESAALTVAEMPSHSHNASLSDASASVPASSSDADKQDPAGRVLAKPKETGLSGTDVNAYVDSGNESLAPAPVSGDVAVANTGGGRSFSIAQPSLAIHYVICTQGLFPSRG